MKLTGAIGILEGNYVVTDVVVFTGEGCAPCKALKEKLKAEFIEFEEKPIVEFMKEARALGIRGVPFTAIYKNGELVGSVSGNNVDKIKEVINAD